MTRRRVEISPGFWLFLGIVLLWMPLSQAVCLFGAAGLHELGHLLASIRAGGGFRGIRLGFFGWEMALDRERLSYRRQILVDLAGPLMNALVCGASLLFIRARPTPSRLFFFFCNALYGAAQLLPIPQLDGGRALTAALSLFLPRETAERIAGAVGWTVGAAALAAGILLFRRTGNPSPALFLPGAALTGQQKKLRRHMPSQPFFQEQIT